MKNKTEGLYKENFGQLLNQWLKAELQEFTFGADSIESLQSVLQEDRS